MKEIPSGRKQLEDYALAASAYQQILESLDIYYPYKALPTDGLFKIQEKATYREKVIDKLRYSNLKQLKFEVQPKWSTVELGELDDIIDKSSSGIPSLSLASMIKNKKEVTFTQHMASLL